jgi:hypothetical protein
MLKLRLKLHSMFSSLVPKKTKENFGLSCIACLAVWYPADVLTNYLTSTKHCVLRSYNMLRQCISMNSCSISVLLSHKTALLCYNYQLIM